MSLGGPCPLNQHSRDVAIWTALPSAHVRLFCVFALLASPSVRKALAKRCLAVYYLTVLNPFIILGP